MPPLFSNPFFWLGIVLVVFSLLWRSWRKTKTSSRTEPAAPPKPPADLTAATPAPEPPPDKAVTQRTQLQQEVADLFRERNSGVANEFSDIQSQLQSVIQKEIRQYPPGEREAVQERHKARQVAARLKHEEESRRLVQAEELWNLHVKALRRASGKFEGPSQVRLAQPLTVPVKNDGERTLPPGTYSATMVMTDASARDDDEPGYLAAVKLSASLTLQDGSKWTAVSVFSLHDIAGMERLSGEGTTAPELRFWDDLNETERRVLLDRCLLAPSKLQSDDRLYYTLLISGKSFTAACRYLSWQVTLFLACDGLSLICRVDRLTVDSSGLMEGEEALLPPFWFAFPVSDLLPGTGIRHFRSRKLLDDVLSEEVEPCDLPASDRIIYWERLEGVGR